MYPSVGLHVVCGACMTIQHQVMPKPCSALCTDFGSDPLHTTRGPLLGHSKLEVVPLQPILETFSSLRFSDFLSQSFAVPIYQLCCQRSEVSAGQPAILRWEHSWKAKLLMCFAHVCPSYHHWIWKSVGEPYTQSSMLLINHLTLIYSGWKSGVISKLVISVL